MMYRFPLKRAAVLALVLTNFSACTYLIPADPSVPRYNQVLGERHRPQGNGNGAGPQAVIPESAAAPDATMATSIAPVTVTNLPAMPPVDAATEAGAQMEIASIAPPLSGTGRQMPIENLEFADASAPSLHDVPARPPVTGDETTKSRLNSVRDGLETDRTYADAEKQRLMRDAAAEDSLQYPAPQAPVTPSPPVNVQPPVMTPPPVTVPSPVTITPVRPQSSLDAPGPVVINAVRPEVAPPPGVSQASVAPVIITPPQPYAPPVAPAPIVAQAPEPLMASSAPVYAPPPQPEQLANLSPPPPLAYPPSAGGFDPLAIASSSMGNATPSHVSPAFLPQSRYSFRR